MGRFWKRRAGLYISRLAWASVPRREEQRQKDELADDCKNPGKVQLVAVDQGGRKCPQDWREREK